MLSQIFIVIFTVEDILQVKLRTGINLGLQIKFASDKQK